MAEQTGIEWTDATINYWWGCTKVGPGCDHCYAEREANRFTPGHWGLGAPRRKIKGAVDALRRLDNDYSNFYYLNDRRRNVFIQSMSDLFDTEVPLDWFDEAWGSIERADRVRIQIVTKRISVVEKRLAAIGRTTWPRHAGLIISVVNQAEADRDIPRLLALKAKLGIPWVGISAEPLLGAIDFSQWLYIERRNGRWIGDIRVAIDESLIDWIIVGGESGANARPMHPDWARDIRDQCDAANIAFFFKQWGEWVAFYDRDHDDPDWRRCPKVDGQMGRGAERYHNLAGGCGFHGDRVVAMRNVGKKAAGRLLDGVEHNAMPRAA